MTEIPAAGIVERRNARRGVGDERPVGDSRRSRMFLMIFDRPARPVDDSPNGAAQLLALHHLDVDDLGFGCDAERLAGDGSRDGGAVRVADGRVFRKRRVAAADASDELRMIHRDAAVEDIYRHATASAGMTIRVIEREVALIDTIEREGHGTRGEKRSGAVGGEAIVTGSRYGRLRARQARLRRPRAPKNRCPGGADSGAATESNIRDRGTGAHDTAGLVSHLFGESKLFVCRTSAAVAAW